MAVVAAAFTGSGGAAAVDALAHPQVAVADGFGAGDGLTQYVVSSATGTVTPVFVTTLAELAGVESAQPLFEGTALVAVEGVTPTTAHRPRFSALRASFWSLNGSNGCAGVQL